VEILSGKRQSRGAKCRLSGRICSSKARKDLGVERGKYLEEWKKLGPLVLAMTGKCGKCNHELGESFQFKHPYDKPEKLCMALWHVVSLYTWRASLGFPSWEADDDGVFRLHCPSKNGTVWEMRKE
jgi:uncharacterized repeat protein (TIGR04076 family)